MSRGEYNGHEPDPACCLLQQQLADSILLGPIADVKLLGKSLKFPECDQGIERPWQYLCLTKMHSLQWFTAHLCALYDDCVRRKVDTPCQGSRADNDLQGTCELCLRGIFRQSCRSYYNELDFWGGQH